MKSGVANVKKLSALLKKLGSHEPVPAAGDDQAAFDDPIAVTVFSFMLWESTTKQAQDAMQKLVGSTVDFNELRVALPNEIVSIIGTRYPRGVERAQRLKSTLHSIYLKTHAVSMEHLTDQGKRDIRGFVEKLTDIPSFVAARVLQRCFDVHTIPVDERLVEIFVDQGILSEWVDPADVSAWLSRQVKSKDGSAAEAALRQLIDTAPKPKKKPAPKKKVLAKKPAVKKPAAKKAPTKKAAPKKPTAKKVVKTVAKKTVKKKVAKKIVKKAASKRTAAKKSTAKKTAKKSATKKTAKKRTARK